MSTHSVLKRFGLTKGERSRLLAYLFVSAFGSGVGILVVLHLSQDDVFARGLHPYEAWMIVACGLGAIVSLFLAGERVGQPGRCGLMRAVIATVWISFTAAIIAGTLALPLYGTMFGPFTLAVTMIANPVVGIMWFLNLVLAHVLLTHWTHERESIFARDERCLSYRKARTGSL